jgi:hypothetical protein
LGFLRIRQCLLAPLLQFPVSVAAALFGFGFEFRRFAQQL